MGEEAVLKRQDISPGRGGEGEGEGWGGGRERETVVWRVYKGPAVSLS